MIEAFLLLALGTAPELPKDAPETAMLARCVVCHGVEYVTQQRLTAAQWEKTLVKMQKWGAPITAEEIAKLVPFLAARFTQDAPDAPPKLVPTPADALPKRERSK